MSTRVEPGPALLGFDQQGRRYERESRLGGGFLVWSAGRIVASDKTWAAVLVEVGPLRDCLPPAQPKPRFSTQAKRADGQELAEALWDWSRDQARPLAECLRAACNGPQESPALNHFAARLRAAYAAWQGDKPDSRGVDWEHLAGLVCRELKDRQQGSIYTAWHLADVQAQNPWHWDRGEQFAREVCRAVDWANHAELEREVFGQCAIPEPKIQGTLVRSSPSRSYTPRLQPYPLESPNMVGAASYATSQEAQELRLESGMTQPSYPRKRLDKYMQWVDC